MNNDFSNLLELRSLDFTSNPIDSIPQNLVSYFLKACCDGDTSLLDFSNFKTTSISNKLVNKGVSVILLRHNELKKLPENLEKFGKITELDLFSNNLTTLPDYIGEFQKLERLSLLKNNFSEIPDCIYKLKNLKELSLKENPLSKSELKKIKKALPLCEIKY